MPSIAIIGCGLIGEEHARCLAMLGTPPGLVVDVNGERAKQLAAIYGARHSTDPQDAIGDPSIDCVYICTYHDTHAPLAIQAANAGKNIFLEKPMALTEFECRDIVDDVRRNGVRCMTGFKLHYYALARKAHKLVPSPKLLSAHVLDRRWPDDSWANDPQRGGGNVLSQGCHAVQMLCYLANSRPIRIFAEGGNLHHPSLPIVDTMAATIAFESGACATLTIGDTGEMPHDGKFTFQALDGQRTIHLFDRLQRLTYFDGVSTTEYSGEEDGFLNENREWLAALAKDRRPETSEIHGMRATEILLAGIRSIETHEAQSLEHIA